MHEELFPPKVLLEQGGAPQEEWRGLLDRARELGASVIPWTVAKEASSDIEATMPTSLSLDDFLRVAGDDEAQRRAATRAWVAALRQRGTGDLQFESSKRGILVGGLVFKNFAERVGRMQEHISQNESQARQILRMSFGRAVTPEVFETWKEVVTFFTPPQSQDSGQ